MPTKVATNSNKATTTVKDSSTKVMDPIAWLTTRTKLEECRISLEATTPRLEDKHSDQLRRLWLPCKHKEASNRLDKVTLHKWGMELRLRP